MKPPPISDLPCAICLHSYEPSQITEHHLVPRSRGGRYSATINLCRACHRQVHALFTEKELAKDYSTPEKLLAAPPMQKWISWIRRRKPTSQVSVRSSSRKRDQKRL